MPGSVDRTGVGELTHLDIGAAVAQHFDAFGASTRMTRAIHHQIRAETADDVAHTLDARLRCRNLFDIDGGFRPELARQRQARRLRRADADHPARAHFPCRSDGENPDWTRPLDHYSVAPGEP